MKMELCAAPKSLCAAPKISQFAGEYLTKYIRTGVSLNTYTLIESTGMFVAPTEFLRVA